jgi:4'-phosphopantetheinyl transferase
VTITRVSGHRAHVFLARLELGEPGLRARLEATASQARVARAARFHFEADAIRCLAAEALLHHALREVHGLAPDAVTLAVEAHDKPVLASHPSIHVNLSHSGSWVACAVHDAPVGIDVEVARVMADPPARGFMSPIELDRYDALEGDEKVRFFYEVWTRKESVLKAAGTGLSFGTRQITIDVLLDEIGVIGGPPTPPGTRWLIEDLALPPGTFGALCVETR